MSEDYRNDAMLDMFLFETTQMLENLDQCLLKSEKEGSFSEDSINEIFRIMHTIKGSASMMMFENIATLAHSIEDLFFYLREEKPKNIDYSKLTDYVLEGSDFIKEEIDKIKEGKKADGNSSVLISSMHTFLKELKEVNKSGDGTKEKKPGKGSKTVAAVKNNQEAPKEKSLKSNTIPGKTKDNKNDADELNAFKAVVFYEEGCEMENVRAYTIARNLQNIVSEIFYIPEDILDNDDTVEIIRRQGFTLYIKTSYSYEKMQKFLMQTIFLRDLKLTQLEDDAEFQQFYQRSSEDVPVQTIVLESEHEDTKEVDKAKKDTALAKQSIISVNVTKLDKLMDLVGEMVIAEAMVVQNPDLAGLQLDNFKKSARQLHKITSELQDTVMAIRMVSLSATFSKMHRIVRDMCKKLDKEVNLAINGEDTEVDKNIIEHISDPLMHLVRNSVDHGIETIEERKQVGKPEVGKVTLEAKNAGSDVMIIVKDDGKGLDREKILKKARMNNLLFKEEKELSDREVYNMILLPGFSTNEQITEYSGRGVGMDVVAKNIETVGGSLSIESAAGEGTTFILKIPLTLAIIDGMNVKVGNACYTIPIMSITESFRPKEKDVFIDPDGNEMIMVRGQCYHILRLHKFFHIKTGITKFSEGIIIMLELDNKNLCVFADELLGQQQVVVKSLPDFIRRYKKIRGLAGCTLLGDGSISLIIDVAAML